MVCDRRSPIRGAGLSGAVEPAGSGTAWSGGLLRAGIGRASRCAPSLPGHRLNLPSDSGCSRTGRVCCQLTG